MFSYSYESLIQKWVKLKKYVTGEEPPTEVWDLESIFGLNDKKKEDRTRTKFLVIRKPPGFIETRTLLVHPKSFVSVEVLYKDYAFFMGEDFYKRYSFECLPEGRVHQILEEEIAALLKEAYIYAQYQVQEEQAERERQRAREIVDKVLSDDSRFERKEVV